MLGICLPEKLSAKDNECIPSPPSPCCMWFNRERRGPQTGPHERALQQCGQVVNTQTWRGRAALQTGLISPGLSRPADMRRRGGVEEAGGLWFGLLLFTPLPSTSLFLAGSVVIWAVRIQLKVQHWKKHYNRVGDRQTGRQMHLEAQVSKTAETHQFVNSTIFHHNFNPGISIPPPSLSVSIVHRVEGNRR